MARLYLVRHGETTSNVMKRLDTAMPGAALTDFGVRQAARFALERPVEAVQPPVLISSLAVRAQQTAEVIGGLWGIDPDVADGLHEVQAGDLEDRFDKEAYETFASVVQRWHHGETAVPIPGGESLDDVVAPASTLEQLRLIVQMEKARGVLGGLRTGDVFGEMSLLTGAPRSATITSEGPCEVFVLDRQALAPGQDATLPVIHQPVRRELGRGLGALQGIGAASEYVTGRADYLHVPLLIRRGILEEHLSPQQLERYKDLSTPSRMLDERGLPRPLTDAEFDELNEFHRYADRKYQEIKDDPDQVNRYYEQAPGSTVLPLATGLAALPFAGALAGRGAAGAARCRRCDRPAAPLGRRWRDAWSRQPSAWGRWSWP